MNPVLVPRVMGCPICQDDTVAEDMDIRLWGLDGEDKPYAPARDYYMERTGKTATAAKNDIGRHRAHVRRYLAEPYRPAPINAVTRVAPAETAHWTDVNQNAMNLGNAALRDLSVRLESGGMSVKELTALGKLGVAASGTRMNAEQRGKGLAGIDKLLRLASGAG